MSTKSGASPQAPTTYCSFEVGQHVVCVKPTDRHVDGYTFNAADLACPVVGKVYTVREVCVGSHTGEPCILVDEIPDQETLLIHIASGEVNVVRILYEASCFRPLPKLKVEDFLSVDAPLELQGEPA